MPRVAERLEEMNRECEAICFDADRWASKWKGAGPQGTANFRLLYSSPSTFERPDRVMILGTNPGGDETNADIHNPWVPFMSPNYSAYLDDVWGASAKGQYPIQRAAQNVAGALAGKAPAAEHLLRSNPTGNLIPFRSVNLPTLPRALREQGLKYGLELVELARPRVLCLLSSNADLWREVMNQAGRSVEPDWKKDLGANFTVREASWMDGGTTRFAFALPGLDTSKQARTNEVLAILRQRLSEHGLSGRPEWV